MIGTYTYNYVSLFINSHDDVKSYWCLGSRHGRTHRSLSATMRVVVLAGSLSPHHRYHVLHLKLVVGIAATGVVYWTPIMRNMNYDGSATVSTYQYHFVAE